ncbi:MAG: hypothetical protein KKD44_27255 [Proteobacteria bacterium]|nr:hypothetical protein [Pseudomonadota bacterium]
MEDMLKVGKKYDFRLKNPGGNKLTFYTGKILALTATEVLILDKYGKKVVFNRETMNTASEVET